MSRPGFAAGRKVRNEAGNTGTLGKRLISTGSLTERLSGSQFWTVYWDQPEPYTSHHENALTLIDEEPHMQENTYKFGFKDGHGNRLMIRPATAEELVVEVTDDVMGNQHAIIPHDTAGQVALAVLLSRGIAPLNYGDPSTAEESWSQIAYDMQEQIEADKQLAIQRAEEEAERVEQAMREAVEQAAVIEDATFLLRRYGGKRSNYTWGGLEPGQQRKWLGIARSMRERHGIKS